MAVTCHSSTHGLGSRRSISSYMHNQLGKFANGSEILCKSVFFGGVTRRFPHLNFAFLEGGVGWAATLYSGLVGRWEKRNAKAIETLDPANLDKALLMGLIEEHGDHMVAGRQADLWESVVLPSPAPRADGRPSRHAGSSRRRTSATSSPTASTLAARPTIPPTPGPSTPGSTPLASSSRRSSGPDVGHWDVPDMLDVVAEAYELVERELVGVEDFRDFVFTNPVMLHAGMKPQLLQGHARRGGGGPTARSREVAKEDVTDD